MHAGDTIDGSSTRRWPCRLALMSDVYKYVAYGGLQRPAGRTLEGLMRSLFDSGFIAPRDELAACCRQSRSDLILKFGQSSC
jgi:hypothetical protein